MNNRNYHNQNRSNFRHDISISQSTSQIADRSRYRSTHQQKYNRPNSHRYNHNSCAVVVSSQGYEYDCHRNSKLKRSYIHNSEQHCNRS